MLGSSALASFTVLALGLSGCGGSSFSEIPSDDGGPADAPRDARANDSPSGDDGDVTIDAPPSHWCAGRSDMFCEDFDQTSNVAAFLGSWSSFQQSGGTFSLDSSGAPSPPNALRATGSTGAQIIVLKTLAPLAQPPSRVRLELDLRITSPGNVEWLSAVGFAAIVFGTRVADGYAAVAIGSGPVITAAWARNPDAGGGFGVGTANGAFPTSGTWAGRYAIEIDYGAGGPCVQVYQGPTAQLQPCLSLPSDLSNPSVLSIALGDYAGGFGRTGDVDIAFDNVTFDVE
jgi:hypothetical protein